MIDKNQKNSFDNIESDNTIKHINDSDNFETLNAERDNDTVNNVDENNSVIEQSPPLPKTNLVDDKTEELEKQVIDQSNERNFDVLVKQTTETTQEKKPNTEEQTEENINEDALNNIYRDIEILTGCDFEVIEKANTTAKVVIAKHPLNEKVSKEDYKKLLEKDNFELSLILTSYPTLTSVLYSRYVNDGNVKPISCLTQEELALFLSDVRSILDGEDNLAAVSDSNNIFVQAVDAVDVKGNTSRIFPYKVVINNDKLSSLRGDNAALVIEKLNEQNNSIDGLFTVPLYYSGFWVTLKSPSRLALVNLRYRIIKTQEELNTSSLGANYSNERFAIIREFVDLLQNHIFTTSLPQTTTFAEMCELIDARDIDHLAWGMTCAYHPEPHTYSRLSISPDGDDSIITGTIDLTRLQFVNKENLTPEMLMHMTKRGRGQMKIEDVKEYQNKLHDMYDINLPYNNEKTKYLMLGSVSLKELIEQGEYWRQNCIDFVDTMMLSHSRGEEDDVKAERRARIDQYMAANQVARYSHFVKGVQVKIIKPEGDEIITWTDRETITSLIKRFAAEQETTKIIIKNILKYISNSTLAIIATPSTDSEYKQNITNDIGFPSLIPLDPLMVFFILAIRAEQEQ